MSVFLGSAYAELNLKMTGFTQGLATAKSELNSFKNDMSTLASDIGTLGKNLEGSGKVLTKSITAPVVAIGAAAVKTTADFDTSMSKVQALSGATGEEFDTLRDKAIEMGGKTAFSATEAADAFSYMALAGWDTNQMLDGIAGVLDLAASSQMDLAQASDLVTDYLTAFGLEAADAGRMADQLAYAQANSNTTTVQLGDAFGNCAAQMHTAGQTMETTTAFLEAMANQGLKGSEAGTALAAVMRDITQNMEDGSIAIGNTTIQVQDQEGNFRNLIDIMADVEKATDGLGTAEKSAALMQTFTARSIKAVSMGLTEGTDKLRNYENALNKTDGAAGNMADTMLNNLNGQITILKSTMETLLIQIGDILLPYISKFVEKVRNVITWLQSLNREEKEQVVKIAAIAAAIGPILLTLAKLITTITTLKTGVVGLVTFIVAHPILAGVAATIGIVVAAGMKLNEVTGETSKKVEELRKKSEELRKEAEEYSSTIDAQVESNEKLMTSIDAEYGAQEKLIGELQSIVDENGRVKTGYEERAQVIVNELASAFGIEIEYQDGVIQKYDEVMQKIDEVIEKKKAEALLSANQQAYVDALSEQRDRYDQLNKAQENLTSATSAYNDKLNEVNDAYDRWQEATASGDDYGAQTAQKEWEMATQELEELKGAVDDATESYNKQADAFYQNQAVIENYEQLQQALIDGTVDLSDAVTDMSNNLVQNAPVDYLKQQADDAKAYYEQMLEDYESGNIAISEAQLAAAKANSEEAQKILTEAVAEYRAQGQNAVNGYSEELAKGAKDSEKAAGDMAQAAIDKVQEVNDSHSPSKKYKGLAKDAVDGYDEGLEENFPTAIQTLQDNIQLMLDTMAEANPEYYNAGITMFENLWKGLQDEWAQIKVWFEDVVRQAQAYAEQIKSIMSEANAAANGSHAGGLSYVPFNGYIAQLHEGERVLTRNEAEAYNKGKSGSGGGYVFNYYSPRAIDPYEANKLFKQSVREVEEGFT